ncbi:MAG: TonB-dependent receptor [Bradymonadaceae bacterium]|nr:TonB-dependent receptor [Lujinxingiaceae bacterium]
MSVRRSLVWFAVLGLSPAYVAAQQSGETIVIEVDGESGSAKASSTSAVRLPQIEVIGQDPGQLESVPGSAAVITADDLEQQTPLSVNEALRNVAGVHIVEEDGIGLRPNISIRGLNPDRSRNVLILEDGVPIALAPYGEPELYYAPAIERMERVEVVKGSGSILWGPQTIGGVVNFITPGAPEQFTATAEARGGNFGYYTGILSVGDTLGRLGYRVTAMHQGFEGHRALNLRMTDVTTKLSYRIGATSSVGLKLQFYDELSSATYLGLTTPQFEADPGGNYAINDELPVRRYAFSLNHEAALNDSTLLQTVLYGHNITRNWNRQDFDRSFDAARSYDRIIDGQGHEATGSGQPDSGRIFFRPTMGSRDREFTVGGIEPRLTFDYNLGAIESELIVGTRLHAELTNEQRIDSNIDPTIEPTVREDEVRYGMAVAGYVQNRFTFFERLRVSPGLRVESFWNDREILRMRVDGTPTDLSPTIKNSDHILAIIPGLGVSYALLDELTLFGGAHRGFAPPRTKDAVTNDGTLLELDAEYSINYELGARANIENYLAAELTGFVLDFSNQIIAPSEASGAVSQAPEVAGRALINAGETRHIGVESSVSFDIAAFAGLGFRLPLSVTYTWVDASFGEGWLEDQDGVDGIAGNRLPYAPEHRVYGQLRFVHPSGIAAQVGAHYITEQFTDKANTVEPSTDGLIGAIDPRLLLDARVAYTYEPLGLTAFVSGKNLTDERYIASRAPQGIQPGMFRQFVVGVRGTY